MENAVTFPYLIISAFDRWCRASVFIGANNSAPPLAILECQGSGLLNPENSCLQEAPFSVCISVFDVRDLDTERGIGVASDSSRRSGRPQKESRLLWFAAMIMVAPGLLRQSLAAGMARFGRFGATAVKSPGGPGGAGIGGGDNDSSTSVITRTKTRTKKPSMYRVLLLNDDYTPMEFVVLVLQRYFNKSADEATQIMLHVHRNGVGECGVFTYEVAETKVTQVMDFAHKHQHPLQCIMEKK